MNSPSLTHSLPNSIITCELSIIVPVHNEQEVLPKFHQVLISSLEALRFSWEIIYVDDGSTDNSNHIIKQLRLQYPQISLLSLSRNFGKESAMSAGLRISRGNAIIILDADLQDPPELIGEMIRLWKAGADVVNMRRISRKGESRAKKFTACVFYRVINRLADIVIPRDIGDFRLLSRRVVDALNQLPETNRFMKGLFSWVGYQQVTLDYERDPRHAGETKWNYWKLWNFALDGITSFSIAPLKFATYSGLICATGAFVYALFFLIKTLLLGVTTPGFPTLIITVLILGGSQLVAIGLLGEYMGRLYMESKKRPLFLIDEYIPSKIKDEAFVDESREDHIQ